MSPQSGRCHLAHDVGGEFETLQLTHESNITLGAEDLRWKDSKGMAQREQKAPPRAPVDRPRGHRLKHVRDGLGVCCCHSASSCFDGFRYPPVVDQHCQQVAPLHFFAEDGTHGNGVEGANKFMKAALIIPDG